MNIVLTIFIASFCLATVTQSKKSVPSFLKLCKQSDPNLDKCISESIEDLRPYLAKGIPEMKILPMNPLVVPKLELHAGNVESYYTDLKFHEAHTVQMRDIHFDLAKNTFSGTFHIDALRQSGEYEIRGRLLVFDLNGSGHFTANFTNVNFMVLVSGERKMKNGREYIDFNGIDLKVKIGTGKMHLDDLFKGNPELTERTNEVLNENSAEFLPELEPLVGDAMSNVLLSTIQNVFNSFPLDELLPK